VPAWSWAELGPMIQDLDALYLNFISGFELALGTAQALRQGFGGFIYADLHSLLLGLQGDGYRQPQPLPDAPSWFGCFDVIQVNEEEMNQLGPNPLSLATAMLRLGASALIVTLGSRGAVYVTDQPVGRAGGKIRRGGGRAAEGLPTLTALIPAERVDEALDPTGCGDVFGAAACARLLAGEQLECAIVAGNRAAARNVAFRGASGLAHHLRGRLVTP
jgi:pfkB family carbohydrate kinase